jgi:hypothetical protein
VLSIPSSDMDMSSSSSSSVTRVLTSSRLSESSLSRRRRRRRSSREIRGFESARASKEEEEEEERDEDVVNYFAYGSNVGSKTFSSRRNMRPIRVQNGKIRDYRLTFNVAGLPFFEPAFASVTRNEGEETHGVCYSITKEEFRYLLQTEGSYDVVDVEVFTYDGVVVKAKTLTHRDVARRKDLEPSKRYRDLIVEGAKERGLEKAWIERLEKMPYFDPEKRPLNAFEMSVLAAALPVVFARAAPEIWNVVFSNSEQSENTISNERKLVESFLATQKALYDVHDSLEGIVGKSGVLGDNR